MTIEHNTCLQLISFQNAADVTKYLAETTIVFLPIKEVGLSRHSRKAVESSYENTRKTSDAAIIFGLVLLQT